MKITKGNVLAAPCGLYCGECSAYKAKDNPVLLNALVEKGIEREKLPCLGCRQGKGECPAINCECETYKCVENRDIDFCFECTEFPCSRLNPSVDKATALPHNIKIYNLCYIKQHGVTKWLEKASEIQERYFKGKMIIGKGPQL
ncbi:MAG: hypothetical protein H6Q67_1688 [Firmicutes bacterium]|nr:hypothetical protein [Bacillota bacterium]